MAELKKYTSFHKIIFLHFSLDNICKLSLLRFKETDIAGPQVISYFSYLESLSEFLQKLVGTFSKIRWILLRVLTVHDSKF